MKCQNFSLIIFNDQNKFEKLISFAPPSRGEQFLDSVSLSKIVRKQFSLSQLIRKERSQRVEKKLLWAAKQVHLVIICVQFCVKC